MNRPDFLTVALLTSLMAGCASTSDPLTDMRELKPATNLDAPATVIRENSRYSAEAVERGRYLVELLGCGSCHTDGALVGTPDPSRFMAGSNVGIAYSNPMQQPNPGVVYPANLTPDPENGIGRWTDRDLEQMIRVGIDPLGGHALPVMPWPAYARLQDQDVSAVIAYLRSLPSVDHPVPRQVAPGQKASHPFVYFGVYQSQRR